MTFKKFFTEQITDSIVILPGGFKPPHKGHFEALKYLLKKSKSRKALVIVGKLERDGITQDQSVQIWNVYKRYIPADVEIIPAMGADRAGRPATPLSMTYDFIQDNKKNYGNFFVGAGAEDLARFKGLEKDKEKYPNTTVVSIPPQFNRISGTETRNKLKEKNIDFIPDEIGEKEEIKKILGI